MSTGLFMRKTPPDELRCPVCSVKEGSCPLQEAARVLRESGLRWLWHDVGNLVKRARANELQWACANCLRHGRAIPANPLRQTFCDYPPYLAYYDVDLPCGDCGCTFTFTAEEQRYWYEELAFFVQSRPNQCAPCRGKRRERKRLQGELQAALAALNERDPAQLAEIGRLHVRIGNQRSGLTYLRRARNLAARTGASELEKTLDVEITALLPQR